MDGNRILEICGGAELRGFTDDYIDRIVIKAASDSDPVIQALAKCLVERRPPTLLAEVGGLEAKTSRYTAGSFFKQKCREGIQALAKTHKLKVGQFLICGPKPIKFEERGSLFSRDEAEKIKPEEREEIIKVFRRGCAEPESLVDVDGSIIHSLSNQVFSIQRLYLVQRTLPKEKLNEIRATVREWTNPPS